MIDETILREYGAVEKQLVKGEILFVEGDTPVYYYQVLSGIMKMNNYNENGNETIQAIFTKGQSFGEPAIFGDFPFPANAEAVENTCLICLEKKRFIEMLKEHAVICIELLRVISKRLQFKAMIAKEISGHEAEHRILAFLNYLKTNSGTQGEFQVNLTRQTIAGFIGLRVETVIRAIGELKRKGEIKVRNRKIYL
ncbi:MAG: Crp/Fnr family transcriptional regulator [Saprospiraceae bacterium]|nr:Crp/Fnr family transcriptional regulator [Saprospiraceae bacterium]